MRINTFLAQASGLSRRQADLAIENGRVVVNGQPAKTGQQVSSDDVVELDKQPVVQQSYQIVLLHKPAGCVVSRNGQGSQTIYDFLPDKLHHLKPVGRLDKDSSGLLVMTNDGTLAHSLTHPSFQKEKVYVVALHKRLEPNDKAKIEQGIRLEDGLSRFTRLTQRSERVLELSLHEGRNRQIRRTFAALGYEVTRLHRTSFGYYELANLAPGHIKRVAQQ